MHAPRFTPLFLRLTLFVLTAALPLRLLADVSFEEGLKSHLGKLNAQPSPGVAVLIARDGKIIFQGGSGLADVEKKVPITAETKFRIGSITKQFTAAAILKLAEEGELSLTDPLKKYFPGFPGAAGITIHHLLTHTSGIHSYTDKPDFIGKVIKGVKPGKLIEFFKDDPPDFAPGEGFHYNNSAYFLAGEVIAKVSGKTYAGYLREAIFEPLGMKDTGVFDNSAPPPGIAIGYSVGDGKSDRALDWDMSWAGGAGALYSTVGDLFKWNEALFGGKLLNEASFKTLTTPVKLPKGVDGMSYGYGLVVSQLSRLPAVGHGGGLNGWSSDLLRLPAQHCTVVSLANAMPAAPGFEPGAITRKAAEKLLEAEIKKLPPPVEDPNADKTKYPDYAGRYDYKNAVMAVTVEDERLYAQLTGQEKNEIFPGAPDEFFWKVTDAQVAFVRNEKGEVTGARHSQAGNTFTAPRITAAEINLSAKELDAILGDYKYSPGATLSVTRDGDTIFAQLTGQPKFQIFPKSATEFEWRVVKASIRFEKDKEGKVTKAVHSQNGATIEAPKTK